VRYIGFVVDWQFFVVGGGVLLVEHLFDLRAFNAGLLVDLV